MNKQLVKFLSPALFTGLAFSLFGGQALAGTIEGSSHDFSLSGWAGGEICVACHTPHNADTSVTDGPLWNHAVTATTFTLYNSPTLDATVSQPGGSSKLCLSCHDGTVALDSFGGNNGSLFLSGPRQIGTDIGNDHPISIVYDSALATADGSLHDPVDAAKTVTIGGGADTKSGTLDEMLLFNTQVQCASCHDVHNKFTNGTGTTMLRIDNSKSALCLTCHNK